MIKNKRQYRIAKGEIEKFREAIEYLCQQPPKHMHPVLLKAQREAQFRRIKQVIHPLRLKLNDELILQAA